MQEAIKPERNTNSKDEGINKNRLRDRLRFLLNQKNEIKEKKNVK